MGPVFLSHVCRGADELAILILRMHPTYTKEVDANVWSAMAMATGPIAPCSIWMASMSGADGSILVLLIPIVTLASISAVGLGVYARYLSRRYWVRLALFVSASINVAVLIGTVIMVGVGTIIALLS